MHLNDVFLESPEPEEPEPEQHSEPAEREKSVEDISEPEAESKALFIDGVDFNVPSSPDPHHYLQYYYSPAPESPPPESLPPPWQPQASGSGSGSHGETKRVIRESPGRPSKSAWKKRNPS